MAKDPAFLFYSQDFFTGVATLTFEERGQYITILCLMHQQGRMSEKTIRFLVGSISDNLKAKFKIDENGLWYNSRLEKEASARAKFTESRRANGLSGGRPKKTKEKKPNGFDMDNHTANRMENEIENEIENELKGVQGDYKTTEQVTPAFESSLHPQFSDNWFADIFNELEMENIRSVFREHDLKNELMIFKLKVRGSKSDYISRDFGGIRSAFIYQLKTSNAKKHDRKNGKETIRRADAVIEAPTSWGKF